MKEKRPILVTAALPYANGPLHIGHIAGCYLPADIYVRYLRLLNEDVLFICGSDEHGVPITIRAQKEGVTPQQVVDKYHGIMKKAFDDFGIEFSIYSRTSSPNHHATSQEIFLELYNTGVFTEETTEQYYDEQANQFLADRYIVGTCPKCQNPNAYGDQCEKCGSTLSPSELINPKSALSGNKPILKATKNWYLPLDKLQKQLDDYIESHKTDWKSNVYGQCKSWLNQGLQPRAMTRDLDWGVKVPLKDAEGKVMYVWFDAPIGYISFTKEHVPQQWERYWKNKDARIIHFIGKDNIVFHCLIFPAMLMSAKDYCWAQNVPANEFLNLEGDKISTSRNHAVWLHEYLQDFSGKTDELRYVLTSIAPETKDADFTWKDYQLKVNSELVAILGNFVNRVMVLSHKYYNGIVPSNAYALSFDHHNLVEAAWKGIDESMQKLFALLNEFKFRDAQFELMNIARIGNKLLADTEPWKLAKTNANEVETLMAHGLQITALLGLLCEPFLPKTSAGIKHQLNLAKEVSTKFWAERKVVAFMEKGDQLNEAQLLFKNIEDAEIAVQLQKLEEAKKQNAAAAATLVELKPEITFDDFSRLDIRVGQILDAQKIKGADKLLQLTVDIGLEKRTIVSGIAEHFKAEEVVGKKVSVLVNLAPRKMRGVESQGMILMAEDPTGKLTFVSPPNEEMKNGSVIR